MKLCTNCLQELFDKDIKCIFCNNEDLIDKFQLESIKNQLAQANNKGRKKLTKEKKYACVYSYLTKKNGERYWKEIDLKIISQNTLYPSKQEMFNVSTTPTIECPYCHSTDTKKISTLSKAGSIALFGIFALGKTSKQFHCNSCSADF